MFTNKLHNQELLFYFYPYTDTSVLGTVMGGIYFGKLIV